ncbi:bifunctional adenosylcobinamide kinase/adenosylcobinamide-phosphate guanylyltransferase [Paenibacillus sp. LHD-117]|uniref:bifunctional adenosylcobinamide kinase/adenosylcobinamide-phosphate guanylyltransferase n=1 Tax=Paenibacillus sp. LHD-117 TaxID=3071412 RepID=UPI0027E1780C|nr:bifunctional adenosylcobinamide kinase/adenosylcobinamide-phosphate guanylyltransferase [Paenibacillus sp. LHD-117]MDQ6421600.1 bifunctional adenosylcobinamide kinase/adenosylcobinamide-phosphate guanylyltransferase [Paenibacillus sp. LHD-117]
MAILITGGARSGKSAFAERYARSQSAVGIYIATGQPFDDEMEARIEKHRDDRDRQEGMTWITVEEPFALAEWLNGHAEAILSENPGVDQSLSAGGGQAGLSGEGHSRPVAFGKWSSSKNTDSPSRQFAESPVVLVDCLTLWLTNWLLRKEEDPSTDLRAEMDRLVDSIARFPFPLLIVTNEVGDGIVPSYPLGRRFRDEAGWLNQRVAAACECVFLVTSGIPVDLRAIAFRFEDGR